MPDLDPRTIVTGFAWLVCAVTLLSMLIAGVRMGRRPRALSGPDELPPISILRPVCGVEAFSEETLSSAYRLDYPAYEIVFCVASSADPVVPLVRRLMAAHPAIPSRLLVGDDRISQNPKLNNCVKGWSAARHDWIVMADSNTLMPPDYVRRMLAAWRPNTGLVCSTPVGSRPDGFWAEVECAFLNTLQARWQYTGEAVGLGFAQGKSMLWHRPFLDANGGIRALANEIAEDAAATKLVRAAGRRVHLVDQPFPQPLGHRSAAEVWARQIRWARLRRVTFLPFFLPEILIGAAVPAAALCLAAPTWGSALAGVIGLLALWYGGEALLARRLGWHLSARMPAAFLVRDLTVPALWAAAFLTRHIVWRGNAMDISTRTDASLAAEASKV